MGVNEILQSGSRLWGIKMAGLKIILPLGTTGVRKISISAKTPYYWEGCGDDEVAGGASPPHVGDWSKVK